MNICSNVMEINPKVAGKFHTKKKDEPAGVSREKLKGFTYVIMVNLLGTISISCKSIIFLKTSFFSRFVKYSNKEHAAIKVPTISVKNNSKDIAFFLPYQ